MPKKRKRLMILGATASGKTDLACEVSSRLNGAVISVDSRQCYRLIDKGTAKPDKSQLELVPHYNIDILNPGEQDSVSDFLARESTWREELQASGKQIVYAGGSTLHLQSLLQPLDPLPPSNKANQHNLREREKDEGLDSLYQYLVDVDPDYAAQIDGLNRHRIFRALDVWMQTGKPFSTFHSRNSRSDITPPPDLIVFGLHWPRPLLHKRIEQRVERMIESGIIEETRELLDKGYSKDDQFLRTVGYRSVIRHLEGELSFDLLVEKMKTETRRYAKRQLTWFRRWEFINWLDADRSTLDELTTNLLKQAGAL